MLFLDPSLQSFLQARWNIHTNTKGHKSSDGLMDKVSASQPRNRVFEPHTGHDHNSSSDTSTGWFQEADSRVITKVARTCFTIELK